MKRCFSFLATSTIIATLHGQAFSSVQDGDWSDPATWDCNCVPPIPSNIFVMHHVTQSGPLSFGPTLMVAGTGHLEQVSPGYIACNPPGNLTIEGILSSASYMATGCPVLLTGTWMAGGGLYAGLGLQMDGGILMVNGNFSNGVGSPIGGVGQICITDSSNIQGPLTGNIDLCDLTPTTSVPPFVDGGASFVASTITFCQSSVCGVGLRDAVKGMDLHAFPMPATKELTVTGVFNGRVEVRVLDAVGATRNVRWERKDDRIMLQLDGLAPGLYFAQVHGAGQVAAVRFVKE